MTAIPLLSGVGAKGPEWVDRHPLNLEPVPVRDRHIEGPASRLLPGVTYATGPGTDRGGSVGTASISASWGRSWFG
jgi:hypothetical protein